MEIVQRIAFYDDCARLFHLFIRLCFQIDSNFPSHMLFVLYTSRCDGSSCADDSKMLQLLINVNVNDDVEHENEIAIIFQIACCIDRFSFLLQEYK